MQANDQLANSMHLIDFKQFQTRFEIKQFGADFESCSYAILKSDRPLGSNVQNIVFKDDSICDLP